MKLFVDTEFNGNHGELISMALVGGEVIRWYEVATNKLDPPNEWVLHNVIPVLDREPIGYERLQQSLWAFLSVLPRPITIVYDWPEDAAHFLNAMVEKSNSGSCPKSYDISGISFEFFRPTSFTPKVPHNALSDATALMQSYHSVK